MSAPSAPSAKGRPERSPPPGEASEARFGGNPPSAPIAVGDRFAKEVVLDEASIRAFATLCGDMNPLHHDAQAAREYGGIIASGPHTVSLMLGLDATHLSSLGVALGMGFDFKFLRAVRAGTRLELAWTVVRCEHKPSLDGWIVGVEGEARGSDGTLYVSARGANLLRPRVAGARDAAPLIAEARS